MNETPTPADFTNVDAEQSAIGAIAHLGAEGVRLCQLVGLQADDFYREQWRIAWNCAVRMTAADHKIDSLTLAAACDKAGLDDANDKIAVAAMTVPVASSVQTYAQIVKANGDMRRVVAAAHHTLREARDTNSRPVELAGQLAAQLREVHAGAQQRQRLDGEQIAERVLRSLDEPERPFCPTPWPRLSRLLGGGWRQGGVSLLAADPNASKTICADLIAEHAARHGWTVAIYDTEGDEYDLAERRILRETEVPIGRVRDREVTVEQKGEIINALWSWPLTHVAAGGMTLADVEADIAAHGVQLAVLDMVSDFEPAGKVHGTTERHDRVALETKWMAQRTGCHVVGVLHLLKNRDRSKSPSLSDVRDSGKYEGAARNVCLLHRPLDPDDLPGDELELTVAKAKQGRSGVVDLHFDQERLRVTEMPQKLAGMAGSIPQWEAA